MAQIPMAAIPGLSPANSDDDIFIPIYISVSSDEETIPRVPPSNSRARVEADEREEDEISIDEKPDSSEELSSQSQSSSQENHADENPNQDVTVEIRAVMTAPRRKKKSKKNKKGSKPKGKKNGGGPKKALGKKDGDPEMKFLEEYLIQNKPVEWKINPTAVVDQAPTSKPKIDELRQKLREKKAFRNSPMNKIFDRFNSQSSIREQLKKGVEKRQALLSAASKRSAAGSNGGSKDGKVRAGDLLGLHQQATMIQNPVSSLAFGVSSDRIEMLIRKYEDLVAEGKLTLEEAIELACRGKDITEPEILGEADHDLFTSEEDKRRQMEYYYRAISKMDPENSGRMKSNIPAVIQSISNEFVDHSFECGAYIEMMKTIMKVERSMNDDIDRESSLNHAAWVSMCNIMYEKFSDKMKLNTSPPITDPMKFYEEALKSWIVQLMHNDLERLDKSGVFERYNPTEQPLILACFQKHVADLFPSTQLVLDMKKVVEAGFAPKEAFSYNPHSPEHKILAFGLFWSFSCSFNLFVAFFRDPNKGYAYYWIAFDRLNEDIDSILRLPRKTYKESVVETVTDKEAILDYKRELLLVEVGSTSELEHCITINSDAVLEPDFMKEVAAETDRLLALRSDDAKESSEGGVNMTLVPGLSGQQQIKVEFKDNATAEEKARALRRALSLSHQ